MVFTEFKFAYRRTLQFVRLNAQVCMKFNARRRVLGAACDVFICRSASSIARRCFISHAKKQNSARCFFDVHRGRRVTIRDLDFDALVDDDRRAGGHASAPRFKDAAVAVHRRRQSSRVDVGSFVNMEAGSPHRTTWQLTRNRAPISAEPSAETSFSDRSFLEVKKLNGATATQRRCCVRCSDSCDGG